MLRPQYYLDGTNAKNVRSYVRGKVLLAATQIVTAAGMTVGQGAGQIPVLKSSKAASNRLQSGQGFLLFLMRPTPPPERYQILGHDDNKAHSGRKYLWTFVIQVSKGNIGGEVTSEKTVTSDDAMMDLVLSGFQEKYVEFREELFFRDLVISPSDDPREGGGVLNPLTLSFSNIVRMPQDEFITFP